jgi:hypothetical protein
VQLNPEASETYIRPMTPFLHKQEEKKCKRYSLERHYHSHAFGQSGACETQCIKTSIHFRIEGYLLKNDAMTGLTEKVLESKEVGDMELAAVAIGEGELLAVGARSLRFLEAAGDARGAGRQAAAVACPAGL